MSREGIDAVLAATDQSTAARYEYDPYGNVIASAGPYAAANRIRFSTKWWDTETGLGYWGYRYCSARLGRWMSRDPIEEAGGSHLCQFAVNGTLVHVDSHGKSPVIIVVGGTTLIYEMACAACALLTLKGVERDHVGQGKDDGFIHCVINCRMKRRCPPERRRKRAFSKRFRPRRIGWTTCVQMGTG